MSTPTRRPKLFFIPHITAEPAPPTVSISDEDTQPYAIPTLPECPHCEGRGVVGVMGQTSPDSCWDTGEDEECGECGGEGVVGP